MKRLPIILFYCLMAGPLLAQSRAFDSINNLIAKATTDTARIRQQVQKAKLWSEVNLDSATILATQLIAQSKKINYARGEADAYFQLAGTASRKGEYVLAKQSLDEATAIVKTLHDSTYDATLYAAYGMMYGIKGVYDTSAQYYLKAIDLDEKLKRLKSLASDYGNMAISYQMQSNFAEALRYQQKSLTLAEQTHNVSNQAYTLMNMGNTYEGMGDTARCEQYVLKAIEVAKSIGIKNVELYGYTNLASLYNDRQMWQLSYNYAMKGAELAKVMRDAPIQASSMSKASLALGNMGRKEEAEILNREAIKIADSTGQPMNIGQAYASMGQLFRLEKKYKDAIPFYEKALPILAQTDPYSNSTAQNYFELADCYEKNNNYEKALTNYKEASKIQDSVHSKDNVRKATELNMTYEFEKKQSIARAMQDKQNAVERSKQFLLVTGLALMVIVAILAWIAYRNKQKANDLLNVQKTEIESTLTQLKDTQAQLVQSEKMASLGELTAGIAHEIQNPLNFVNNFSEVNVELIGELNEAIDKNDLEEVRAIAADIVENEKKINHHGKRADGIVKGMLQHSRKGTKEPTDINALADEYLRLAYHGLRAKDKTFNAQMSTHFDEQLSSEIFPNAKINVVPQDIGRVILNLITNAFYAVTDKKKKVDGPYEPTVTVSTKRIHSATGDQIEVTVGDNGNGVPPEVLEKIFQPFFTTKPTGQGTGLGLSMSYDIVTKEHGGTLRVENKEGQGASFIIQIPV